jgi:hypothetical protein
MVLERPIERQKVGNKDSCDGPWNTRVWSERQQALRSHDWAVGSGQEE